MCVRDPDSGGWHHRLISEAPPAQISAPILARSFASTYRPACPGEKQALAENRLLVISPFPASVKCTTRKTALQRNHLVHALADEIHGTDSAPER